MTVRKIAGWALIAFVIFFIATNPSSAANVGRWIGSAIGSIANGFSSFVSGLVG